MIVPTPSDPSVEPALADTLLSSMIFGTRPDRRIDTHAAAVFLTADRAWKIKRPVRFAYLDFSTPDRRRAALTAELALNRQLAPDLYRRVHAITRAADGTLQLDGDGEVVDWVLEMARFGDDALLGDVAGRQPLDPALLTRLVDHIFAFHDGAPASDAPAGAARLAAVIAGNTRAMGQYPATLPPVEVARLDGRLRQAMTIHAPRLDARGRAGRIRHGHGDLHLGNIALIEGDAVPFDRLEFDAELATVDVLYDLAFLVMDCWQRGLRREANLIFNRYLDRSAVDEDTAGAEGAPLLPLFMAVRASIRAHVAATRAEQAGDPGDVAAARRYLALAIACLDPQPARLVAVGGASGTGKSTLARAIADTIGPAPGARILRSDVLRKRAAGLPPEARLPASAYTGTANAAVYEALLGTARRLLAAGVAVIADATFLDAQEHGAIADAATGCGRRFDGLWLHASRSVRTARVGARRNDASDADASVAGAQAVPADAPAGWHCLDADRDIEQLAHAARAALG